jgi:putative serine protease PepD
MFLSVVSAGIALAGVAAEQGRLGPRELQMWRRIEPSIVTVLQNGRASGPAALIDTSGLFVAHRNAVLADQVMARLSDGSTVQLNVKGKDAISQLVVLQAIDWDNARAKAFAAPTNNERPGGSLLAVLPSGPIRAEYVSSTLGVVKPANRLVPLAEFRFEAPATEVGTALVFGENGEFLGALSATLSKADERSPLPGNSLNNTNKIFGQPAIGPSGLTVAYTTGPQVLRRVLAGFRSESHEVVYPSLGVVCSDAIGDGALVRGVTAGSPAAQAGVRFGDVLVDIGGQIIRNQVDFARVMLDQEVGKKIVVRIRRGSQLLFLNAVVAKAD